MTPRFFHRLVCLSVFTAISTIGSRASGNSVVETFSANGVFIRATGEGQWKSTVTDSSGVDNQGKHVDLPGDFVTGRVLPAAAYLPPGGGLAKDFETGLMTTSFTFGSPFGPKANDTFTFQYAGSASAVGALGSTGAPADARVFLHGTANFFLDPNAAFPANTLVGKFVLSPLTPPTSALETVSGYLFDASTSSTTPLAVGGAGDLLLDAITAHAYELHVDYQLLVPHGTDPASSYTYTASLAAVPEPAMVGAVGVGFAMLIGWRRRALSTGR